jgi:hypothetical protein
LYLIQQRHPFVVAAFAQAGSFILPLEDTMVVRVCIVMLV